ncbi:DUF2691 family protein [Paenibacillus sp. FSL W7-1287]|uniref:DUF2691 family protein n=1 Tax=Paenibacillus sp. FSL W7-1287 TaxID=2954538 RepID=UPI0030F7B4CA
MKRGISFEIPNEYGRFLEEILKPLDVTAFDWFVGGEEAYIVTDKGLSNPLFPEMVLGMKGEILKDIIENNKYYLIFADLKAYPKGTYITEINTYKEYLDCDCQLSLLVIDSSYISIYCKESELLEDLYENARISGFNPLEYITDENDFRTGLSVW